MIIHPNLIPYSTVVGDTVELSYPDSKRDGEPSVRKGLIEAIKPEYFCVKTDRGYRNFRYDRIIGKVFLPKR